VDAGLHRIDPEGRAQILAERQVGRGKPERTAALVAMLDPALDLPGPAELLGGGRRTPGPEMLADPGRGENLTPRAGDRLDGGHGEAARPAELGEQRGVAAPALAEDEVVADHDVGDLDALAQHLDDEGLGALAGELGIEMQHQEVVDPDRLELAD